MGRRLKSHPPSPENITLLAEALPPPSTGNLPSLNVPPARALKAAIADQDDDNTLALRELAKAGAELKVYMVTEFKRRGLTTADWLKEIHAIARVAAYEGDYTASFRGYEIIGKHLGALTGDTHLHLHAPAPEQMREMSDAQLQALITQAESTAKEIEATVHDPAAEALLA